ncbi:Coiled-coil domain-containing protein 85B, partial [Ophiophagus hannah]
ALLRSLGLLPAGGGAVCLALLCIHPINPGAGSGGRGSIAKMPLHGRVTGCFPCHCFAPARAEQVMFPEVEKLVALVQHGWLIQGMNWQLQEHLHEICKLKAVNGWLQVENHKLHDLCCFLDEDQLKAKHLALHLQLFGHHVAQVLCYEVASCLCKLAGLEGLLTPLSPLHRSGATVNGGEPEGPVPRTPPCHLLVPPRAIDCCTAPEQHVGKVEQSCHHRI